MNLNEIELTPIQLLEGEADYISSTWEGALIETEGCHYRVLEMLFYQF